MSVKIINFNKLSCIDNLLINTLKSGDIPKHIAVIMDGNRRFGRSHSLDMHNTYLRGFAAMSNFNNLCHNIGVTEVTLYYFSIENFKRPQEEIRELLEVLMPEALEDVRDNLDSFRDHGIRVNVIGDLGRLSGRLRTIIEEVQELTKHHQGLRINLAIAYTARDEIVSGVKKVVEDVREEKVDVEDVDSGLLGSCLKVTSDADCLVRTSGVVRFSDFLLWQISGSFIYFDDTYWPQFGILGFTKMILNYQKTRLLL